MDKIHRRGHIVSADLRAFLYFLNQLCVCAYGLLYFMSGVFALPDSIAAILRFGSIGFVLMGIFLSRPMVLEINTFFKWYAILIIMSYISALYSINDNAMANSNYLLEAGLIAVAFSMTLESKASIKRILYMMAISGGIVFFALASKNLLYIDDRLGRTLTGGNLNMFALYIMLTLMSCIMLFCLTENKLERIILVALGLLDVYMLMLSGGRKYILTPVLMCAIIIWYQTKSVPVPRKIILFIFFGAVIAVGWNFMMTNEVVYMSIGRRFVEATGSTRRLDLIESGIEFFIRSPIWGHGENAYVVLLEQEQGYGMYSHNTYIELLVNLGLIGFTWYYGVYFSVFKRIHRRRFEDKIYLMFDAFILSTFFLHTGIVAYNTASLLLEFTAIACCVADNPELRDIQQ